MHRDAFADEAILSDNQSGRTALVFAILRRSAKDGMMKNDRAVTQSCHAIHHHVAHQAASGANGHRRPDMAKRTDCNIFADDGAILDDC